MRARGRGPSVAVATARLAVAALIAIASVAIGIACARAAAGEDRAAARSVPSVAGEADASDDADAGERGIDPALLRRVDFDALAERDGADATRWLSVPDGGIDDVVMQERRVGSYRYDQIAPDGRRDVDGSFLTPAEPEGADDARLMVLGHEVFGYTGTPDRRFSGLARRWGDAAGAAAHPYAYVYYPDHAERWSVWCAVDTPGDSCVYELPYRLGSPDYGDMLAWCSAHARYERGLAPDASTRTLMLSTCAQDASGGLIRFCLVLAPDARYDYDTESFTDLADARAEGAWLAGPADARGVIR